MARSALGSLSAFGPFYVSSAYLDDRGWRCLRKAHSKRTGEDATDGSEGQAKTGRNRAGRFLVVDR